MAPWVMCSPCCALFSRPPQPLFTIIFGNLMDVLNNPDQLQKEITKFAFYFLYLGAAAIVCFYGAFRSRIAVFVSLAPRICTDRARNLRFLFF